MKRGSSSLLTLASLLVVAGTAHAQIVWGAPSYSGNYTGLDSDINTNGKFVAAVTEANGLGAGNYPVVVADADTTFDLDNDATITNINGGGSDGSHSTTTAYQSALDGVAYAFDPSTFTFTLTGLDATHVYQIQIWDVDSSTSRTTLYSSSGPAGTTSTTVYKGFVLGTLSGVTSQSILVQSAAPNGVGEVNAVAIRDLSAAVPEPSTYAMMLGGLALLGLGARRRFAFAR